MKSKIKIIIIAISIGVVISLFALRTKISNYLTLQSTKFLSRTLNLEISAKEIKGSIFTSVVFSDVIIKFSRGDSLRAETVKSEYNLFSIIFRNRNRIRNLLIIKPDIYLVTPTRSNISRPPSLSFSKLTLPVLFFNKLEIQHGRVFQDGNLLLDSLLVVTNLYLSPKSIIASVSNIKFNFVRSETQFSPFNIHNLSGVAHFFNNTLSLKNIKLQSKKSISEFDAVINFLQREISLDLKKGYVDLSEFVRFDGVFGFNGQINLFFENLTWNLSKIQGNLDYQLKNLRVSQINLADGKGKIKMIDTLINITYLSKSASPKGQSNLNILAHCNFSQKTYHGKAFFDNFNIPIELIVHPQTYKKSSIVDSAPSDKKKVNNLTPKINGIVVFSGIGLDNIELELLASTQNPALESISAKLVFNKGQFVIEKIRIKDHTSILNATSTIINPKRSVRFDVEFSDFALYPISEIIYQFSFNSNTPIFLKGFINGRCCWELTKLGFSAKVIRTIGDLTIRNGYISLKKDRQQDSDLEFEKLTLQYNLSDLQNLPKLIRIWGEDINWQKNKFSQLHFYLSEEKFFLSFRDWANNSIVQIDSLEAAGSIQKTNWGKMGFNFKALSFDNLIDNLKISSLEYTLINSGKFRLGKVDQSFYLTDFSLKVQQGVFFLNLITLPHQKPSIELQGHNINLKDICRIIGIPISVEGILDFSLHSLTNSNSDTDGFRQIRYSNQSDTKRSGYSLSVRGRELKIPIDFLRQFVDFKQNEKYEIRKANKDISTIELKHLESKAIWDETCFYLKHLSFVHAQDTSYLFGTVNIFNGSSKDHSIDLDVVLADPGPWIFFFLKNILNVQQSKIYGQGKITGSLNHPILSGEVKVSDAKLLINSTQTLCRKVDAELIFSQQKIFLNNLKGYAGEGLVLANGFTKLINFTRLETLAYQIEFHDAPIRPHKDVFGIASGKMFINYKPELTNQNVHPLSLAGTIIIKEGLLTTEFAEPIYQSPISIENGSEPDIDLNLTISAERGIWLRNRLCDIELSANLNIFSQSSTDNLMYNPLTKPAANIITYSGQLKALQGVFYYLDHPLKITKGIIEFDNIAELDPLLEINAEVLTRPLETSAGSRERIKIILSLTGRFKEPVFTLLSEPPVLSENDIISYLNFNVTWQEMTSQELKDAFGTAISEKLLGYFERQITKRIRDLTLLDYLWIESGLFSKTGAKVTVGKYIGSHLYFTYEYNISGTSNDIFRLEYYLAKSHQIIGERDLDNRYNIKYQYKIRY